jgi:hypothetical protein
MAVCEASLACPLAGYVENLVSESMSRSLPPDQLYLGQYTRVHLLRLVVDVDGSCQFPKLHW